MKTTRVVPDVLAGWESTLRHLPVDIGIGTQAYFQNNPVVQDAYDDVDKKWDENRTKLRETVDGLANALQMIREAFEDIDAQGAAILKAGGSG